MDPIKRRILFGGVRPRWLFRAAGLTGQLEFGGPSGAGAWLNNRLYRTEAEFKSLLSTLTTPACYITNTAGNLKLMPANSIHGYYGSDRGQLIEELATPLAPYARTLNALAWTASNMTVSAATGADGTASAAVQLTATANNATVIAPSIVSASSARRFAPYIRRISGAGNIDVTFNNGSTWTTLTAPTGVYTRIGAGATLANPQVGVRIATSGDVVLLDFANGESQSFDTSPINSDASRTPRAASSIIANDGTPLATAAQRAKAMFFQTDGVAGGSLNRMAAFVGGATIFYSSIAISNASNSASLGAAAILGAGTNAGVAKSAFGMDATSITGIANAGTQAISANAWSGNTGDMQFGNRAALDRALNGYLTRTAFGSAKGAFDGLTA